MVAAGRAACRPRRPRTPPAPKRAVAAAGLAAVAPDPPPSEEFPGELSQTRPKRSAPFCGNGLDSGLLCVRSTAGEPGPPPPPPAESLPPPPLVRED